MLVPKLVNPELKQVKEDWIVRHGEGEWEWCVQRKCNNPNCPYPNQSWWNAFLYNPDKPDKHIQLMQEYYVTDNNKHHYASSIKPKIHRCMKENKPGKWVNKEEEAKYYGRFDTGNFYNLYVVRQRDLKSVKDDKIDKWIKLTKNTEAMKSKDNIKKEWSAYSFEY